MNSPTESTLLLKSIEGVIQEAREYVSRKVNFAQIVSNWIIGRMIVEDEQKGEYSAEYGKQVIKFLAENLTKDFGSGYSSTNLRYFRQFYFLYPNHHAVSDKLDMENHHAVSDESHTVKLHAVRGELKTAHWLEKEIALMNQSPGHPLSVPLAYNLSWTHHRILLKVDKMEARQFYLSEAHECNWSTRALERQVNSLYYERIISSQNKELVKAEAKEKTSKLLPEDLLKDPMVLEFLQLKKDKSYLETELEQALLNNLNDFLLELGKGFAFVARQKHIRTQTKDYFIDLVFYNYLLKCFVLIELKTRELEHGDIGQMDMYVRYYEDREKSEEDNPTIGIIMATEKDETVVKYSVLNDSKQLFATKYKLFLPSEEELINEIEQSKLNYKLKK